jgi:hypothetical protein
MAAPIRVPASKTFQREKVVFASAIAAYQTALTTAEATAAGNLDISCYLMSTWGRPTQNTNRVTLNRRLCDGAQYEQIGITTYTGGDLQYAVSPQAAAASDGKKAFEKFPEGTTGFFIQRLSVAVNTDLASGQFVNIFPVEFGPGMITVSGDDEASEAVVMQSFAITAPPKFSLAIT